MPQPRIRDLQADVEPSGSSCRQPDTRQILGFAAAAQSVETAIAPPCSPRASEALMTRFITTWHIWEASAWITGKSAARSYVTAAFFDTDMASIFRLSSTTCDRSTGSTMNLPLPE